MSNSHETEKENARLKAENARLIKENQRLKASTVSSDLPEGMRIAEHEDYGRVVVSPNVDKDNEVTVFRLDESELTGAWQAHVVIDSLTFLENDGIENKHTIEVTLPEVGKETLIGPPDQDNTLRVTNYSAMPGLLISGLDGNIYIEHSKIEPLSLTLLALYHQKKSI